MPRNRSEKSPSGDPMVDAYLRAWLRWYRCVSSNKGASRSELADNRDMTYESLDFKQVALMRSLASDYSLSHEDVVRLYGHEAEFQNATQSK